MFAVVVAAVVIIVNFADAFIIVIVLDTRVLLLDWQ